MRRVLFLVVFALLLFSRANAQTTPPDFSVRLGFQALIVPLVHVGVEVRNPENGLGLGVRAKGITIIIIYGFGIDAYGFVPLSPDWDIYFGAGWMRADGPIVNSPSDWTYGILGVRLRQGFFLEITPGIISGVGCNQTPPILTPCTQVAYQTFFILGSLGFAWRL